MATSTTAQGSITSPSSGFWSALDPSLLQFVNMIIPKAEQQWMTEHPDDPAALTSIHKLVIDLDLDTVVVEQGEWKAAEKLFQKSYAERETALGLTNRYTVLSLQAIAITHSHFQRYDQAEATYRTVITLDEAIDGRDSSWGPMSNLGWLLVSRGKYAEGEAMMHRLLPLLQKGFGEGKWNHPLMSTGMGIESPQALGCMCALMTAFAGQGRFAEARELNDEGLEIIRGMKGNYYEAEGTEQMLEMKANIEKWEAHPETQIPIWGDGNSTGQEVEL